MAHVGIPVIAADFDLAVKRNCSISPQAALRFLTATAALCFGVAAVFALCGAWFVVPFAVVEMVVLGGAFYADGRHAADYERITREGDTLIVEIGDADRLYVHRFDARRVRVLDRFEHGMSHVVLTEGGEELEIGRFVNAPGRQGLASLLRAKLADRTVVQVQ